MFLLSLKASFLCRTSANSFSKSIFDKQKIWKNFNFLTKIMDYPLWKNANFAFILNPCLYCLERLVYWRERHQIVFQGVIWLKRNVNKISNFWPKLWTNPFGKMPILGFLKWMFSLSRKACLLYKRSKIVFSRFIFTIYYMGIQGVSRGYMGLQRVTRGYKGIQEVTWCYRGLQGVTEGYKWL